MNQKLLRVDEVALYLDVSRARAYELARRGIIPCVRLGRQVRVDPMALRAWLSQGGTTEGSELTTSPVTSFGEADLLTEADA